MTITLKALQRQAGANGHTLGHEDLAFANQLLSEGRTLEYVYSCAHAWANELERVSGCETADAKRFEDWSYGCDR
jgi:hypothetical protein